MFSEERLSVCVECGSAEVSYIDDVSGDLYCARCARDRGYRNCENEPGGLKPIAELDEDDLDEDYFDEDGY